MDEVNVGSPRIVNLSGDHKGRREYRGINSNLWNSKLDEESKNKETVWIVGLFIEIYDEVSFCHRG